VERVGNTHIEKRVCKGAKTAGKELVKFLSGISNGWRMDLI
jgi:hypothetical protein